MLQMLNDSSLFWIKQARKFNRKKIVAVKRPSSYEITDGSFILDWPTASTNGECGRMVKMVKAGNDPDDYTGKSLHRAESWKDILLIGGKYCTAFEMEPPDEFDGSTSAATVVYGFKGQKEPVFFDLIYVWFMECMTNQYYPRKREAVGYDIFRPDHIAHSRISIKGYLPSKKISHANTPKLLVVFDGKRPIGCIAELRV